MKTKIMLWLCLIFANTYGQDTTRLFIQSCQNGELKIQEYNLKLNDTIIVVDGYITGIISNKPTTCIFPKIQRKFLQIQYEKTNKNKKINLIKEKGIDWQKTGDLESMGLSILQDRIDTTMYSIGDFGDGLQRAISITDFVLSINSIKIHLKPRSSQNQLEGYVIFIGNDESFKISDKVKKSIYLMETISVNYPNDIIFYQNNNVHNASYYKGDLWMSTALFNRNQDISGVVEHEYLHCINQLSKLDISSEVRYWYIDKIWDIYSYNSLDSTLQFDKKDYFSDDFLQGLNVSDVFWYRQPKENNLLKIIKEENYCGWGGHPIDNSHEFTASYIHSLLYKEYIVNALRNSDEQTRKIFFKTGALFVSELKKTGDKKYSKFIKIQLKEIQNSL